MNNEDFVEMTTRQVKEKEFHNQWSRSVDINKIDIDAVFLSPTAAENASILEWFGNLQDANLLDLGSGMGDAAVFFARQGAYVKAVDVSDGMLDISRQLAESKGVSERFFASQMAAEQLCFDDNTFDLVYGNGVLHHVSIEKAINEVYRVLKPGGRAAFIEPLAYNPIIWVYRFLAKSVRSENERPLSSNDLHHIIQTGQNGYSQIHWEAAFHKEYHLSTLALMLWFYFGEGISPAKERYWKLFIESGEKYKDVYRYLQSFDRFIFRTIPLTNWLSWNTVLYLQK